MSTITDRFSGVSTNRGFKAPVRVKTTAAITLSGYQTIDGETLAAADTNLRVLVADQADATENGIYDAQDGAWTRAKDFDSTTDFAKGTQLWVQEGTQAGRWWVDSEDPQVLGDDDITFDTISDTIGLVNNLTSNSTADALTAAQGKVLKDSLDALDAAKLEASDVVNSLTNGGTEVPLSAQAGKEIAEKRRSVEKTASHTLALVDTGYLVRMNVGTANNLTVPPNSDVAFGLDTMIDVAQMGAGQTTIVAGSGVTIRSSGAKLKLSGQYSAASLQKIGTNEWLLVGDLIS